MDTVGERIKRVRQDAKLSMEVFGERVGVTKGAISKIESGINTPAPITLKMICKEFRVNYLWLTQGIGKVYSDFPEALLDMVAQEFNLDDLDRQIVGEYLKLDESKRQLFRDLVRAMFLDPGQKKEARDD